MNTSTCNAAIDLIAQGRPTEAKETALALLEHASVETGRLLLEFSSALFECGDYDLKFVRRAAEIFKHHRETLLYGNARSVMALGLFSKGRLVEARESLNEAYVCFRITDDLAGAARVLNRLARVHYTISDAQAANRALQQSRDIFLQLGDTESCRKVDFNAAAINLYFGNLLWANDYIQSLASAPEAFCRAHRPEILAVKVLLDALHNKPSAGNQGETDSSLSVNRQNPRKTAVLLEHLGHAAIIRQQFDAGLKYLNEALPIALKIAPESALVSQIKRLFADLYIATEDWDKAEQYGIEALAVAEQINERLEIAACWRVFAQVENHRGNRDKAREWFDKAIELFHQIGARYELAVTRYLAAVSGLHDHHKRTALLYLAKEYFESEQVTPFVEKVTKALETEPPRIARPKPKAADAGTTIIGTSKPLRRILDLVDHVAPSDLSILLTGETGTGKDLLARYIHECSGRPGEFTHVNAASIPSEMIEDELFGHIKGAFTGANEDRKGMFEQAAEGTFYLDEIADATPQFQAKLLQVLETRQVRPLGQNALRPITCRVIAATNHDLQEVMKTNDFRTDLFHRLNDLTIILPPLRERAEDIPLLVEHFLREAGVSINHNGDAKMLDQLCSLLASRPWPGNIRELRKFVRRMAVIGERNLGQILDLALEGSEYPENRGAEVLAALEANGWNKSQTARALNVSEGAVRKWIQKYGLEKPE